ncbi:MAG: mechanosensitive ion channel domain-containing protein [Planctomycetota bacterium]
MTSRTFRLIAAGLLCALLLGPITPGGLHAQQSVQPEGEPSAPLTVEQLRPERDRLSSRTDLDPDVLTQALDFYDRAIEQITASAEWRTRAADFDRAIQEAPARLTALKQELDSPAAEPSIEIPEGTPLADLELSLRQAEAELATTQQATADLDEESRRRDERRSEVPRLVAAAETRLAAIEEELAVLVAATDRSVLAEARRTFLAAQKMAVEAELAAYRKETASYTARGDLLTARRDSAARALSRADAVAVMWRTEVAERRRSDAAEAARQAEMRLRELASADPQLREIAEETARLAKRRLDLALKLENLHRERLEVEAQLDHLDTRAAAVRTKVKTVRELTRPVSILLRNERNRLPDLRSYASRIDKTETEITDAFSEIWQLDEESAALADVEKTAREIAADLVQDVESPEYADAEKVVKGLLESKRENLERLLEDLKTKYREGLLDLSIAEQQVVTKTEDFAKFIDERIVWYRSTELISVRDAREFGAFLVWFTSPSRWKDILIMLARDVRGHPLAYVSALALLLALRLTVRRVPALMHSLSERVLTASTDRFSHSLTALAVTFLSASWWPLLVGFLALRLYRGAGASEFSMVIAVGLGTTALLLGTLEFIRISCKEGGLADTHFRWRRAAQATVTANLRWVLPAALPAVFVVSVVNWQQERDLWRESVARIALILTLVALAVFLRRILQPSGKVMEDIMRRHRDRWLERLRYVWYPLLVSLPLVIAFISALGFQYGAYQMSVRLAYSLWLGLALIFLNGFMLRWVFVVHRRLAVEEALRRRVAEMEARGEGPEAATEGAEGVREPEVDIFSMSAQTRQLLRAFTVLALLIGLWVIWADTLPALEFLDRIELWSADGENPVTLKSVLMAVLVVAMTIVAGKNIPGLLEITVLQRLPLDHGVRFAITTVARYVITVVGVIVAFGVMGIGWSKVQWLVAAVSVGLGFGLQEIFGNFISGLIILLERPMRVGDTVTVGNITGTVTRIQIRATTIRDWERRELVVPNKEFITGQLVNWTLSDQVLRVTIPVGIEYGSDTRKAYELLLKVAEEHPNVLADPPPGALFLGFGDSSLNFELRVFIAGIEHFLQVRHDLHLAIDDAFREAGIVIAFPQQDVHIRSVSRPVPLGTDAAAMPLLDPPTEAEAGGAAGNS